MVSFCMKSLLASRNCAATFEMCILHIMMSEDFQFCCMGTISKGGDVAKGSNYLLRFGAWDVLIEDKVGEVSSKMFWKDTQLENAVQTAFMWESLFYDSSPFPTLVEPSNTTTFSLVFLPPTAPIY